jgi:hypothetical protein
VKQQRAPTKKSKHVIEDGDRGLQAIDRGRPSLYHANFFTGGDILTGWQLLDQLGIKVSLFDPRSRRLHLQWRPSSLFLGWPLLSTLFPANVVPLPRPI